MNKICVYYRVIDNSTALLRGAEPLPPVQPVQGILH
jgi:hypothetical protein